MGWLLAALLAPAGWAMDVSGVRRAMTGQAATDATAASAPTATVPPEALAAVVTPQERLARTSATVQAIRQMQLAARALAKAGPNNLRADLPAVPANSYGQANGLILANGVPKDLASLQPGEIAAMWTGARLPTVATTTTAAGTSATEVTIAQQDQQAVLNWQSFNIGKDTTVTFNQAAGGANVGRWVAFNVVRDPTASPTQILGALRTTGPVDTAGAPTVGGQVYVLNTNGIIFGGSAQVNTHALVASALPFNYNALSNGLLNNPDTQFQFSTTALAAGTRGPTPAFDPAVASPDGSLPSQASYAASGRYGDVEVQAGASIIVPTTVDKVGGRVALIGANVRNAGSISTPNGQTILAAGLQVGLAASRDPGLRGLDVYVGAQGDYSGAAANGLDAGHPVDGAAVPGLIDGRRFDAADSVADAAVTIVGKRVDQLGAIDLTTSVSLNGRVDLLAEYNAVGNPQYKPGLNFKEFLRQSSPADTGTGVVTLGAGSVTRIVPESASDEKIVGTELKLPSTVAVRGQAVHLAAAADGTKGATLIANSGNVAVETGQWSVAVGSDQFVHTLGQIYLDPGTAIDVSGSRDVAASVADDIVNVELRGPELADFPLLRDGALRGQTVKVDLRQSGVYNGRAWIGTPLADASGYINLVQHTVGQLTTGGGKLTLAAGGSVVLGSGAGLDVSGGWINFAGGPVETTKVVSDGRIYDVAQATPDRVYTGIYSGQTSSTDPKWGVTSTTASGFPLSVTESSYQQGGVGGSLAIAAPAMALDGVVTGTTVAGTRQRTSAGQLAKTYAGLTSLPVLQAVQAIPKAASLSLAFEQQYIPVGLTVPQARSPTAPTVTITATPAAVAAVPAFPGAASGRTAASLGARGAAKAAVAINPAWFGSTAGAAGGGFGSFSLLNSDGDVTVGANLALPAGGRLAIDAANITVAPGVAITAPAGSLAFTAHNYSPYAYAAQVAASDPTLPEPDDKRGRFLLGKGASLGTAGLVVDDRTGSPTAGLAGFHTSGFRLDENGGEVDAVAVRAYRIDLADNTRIDVSGGALVGATGKLTFGGAGRISLQGVLDPQGADSLPIGQDPERSTYDPARRGYLRFNPATVRFLGYSGIGAKSGALALQAQQIQIEDPAALASAANQGLASPANLDPAGTLLLPPEFFGRDGIGNYTLTGLGSVVRDADGAIVADPNGPGRRFVPAVYVAPTLAGDDGSPRATAVSLQPTSWVAKVGPVSLGPVLLTPAAGQYPTAARAATSLRLLAPGITYSSTVGKVLFTRGDLRVGAGASLALDPKAAVTLAGGTVLVDGRVTAPGGAITVTGGSTYVVAPSDTVDPVLPTVELGAASVLSTAGTVVEPAGLALTTGVLGDTNTGAVLNGGSIAVSGNLVARKNALLDVSGTSGTLNLLAQYSGGQALSGLVPTTVASDGGSITLGGAQVFVSNATLRGAAGGSTAQGGSLTVSSGYYLAAVNAVQSPTDVSLDVTQSAVSLPATPGSLLGQPLVDAAGKPIASLGHFAASDFWSATTGTSAGGLTSLALNGNVRFTGSVILGAGRSLAIGAADAVSLPNLTSPLKTGGFLYAASADGKTAPSITLTAPAVSLGLGFQPPFNTNGGTTPQLSVITDSTNTAYYQPPTTGTGSLTVKAGRLIELGSLSFQGFKAANFETSAAGVPVAGDVRGNGTVDIAGSLSFTAGQIYPVTGVGLTLAAYDSLAADGVTAVPGTITFNPVLDDAGNRLLPELPLSAAGTLTVYGSKIVQNGVLRAPFGVLNLGWNGSGTAPTIVGAAPADLLAGGVAPVTSSLTLGEKSITSVSAVDPVTGAARTVPYGYSSDGLNWFDPSGYDITTSGPPAKAVVLSAKSINDVAGSVIDTSGGGDLYAYRWVPGVGGTADVLGAGYVPNPAAPALRSYAVLPAFTGDVAPYAAYNSGAAAEGFSAGSSLALGDVVHLDLGDGNGARDYTLLPARYALLPGAYLVTPVPGVPPATPITQPDGARYVAGYRTNRLAGVTGTPPLGTFEVALGTAVVPSSATSAGPKAIVRTRAQYSDFLANGVFAKSTDSTTPPAWRLPKDAGSLRLLALAGGKLNFDGSVLAAVPAGSGGRGGLVDFSTAGDVLVTGAAGAGDDLAKQAASLGLVNPLVLRTATLNQFGAESLLIGGYRTSAAGGAAVTVTSGRIAVDNAGETLAGSDVILAARTGIAFADGSAVAATGTLTGADRVVVGQLDATTGLAVPGTGNGALARVSADAAADFQRVGVSPGSGASLVVGAGVQLGGVGTGTVLLDSTDASRLDPTAKVTATRVALDSGQISVQFAGAGPLRPQVATSAPSTGLVLSGDSLAALQTAGTSLSLLSYSSIDFYGSGQLGSATAASLALHTPELRGDGGNVTIAAKSVTIDNSAAGLAPDASVPGATGGALAIAADTLQLGAGAVAIQRYGSTAVSATQGVNFSGVGSLATEGDLAVTSPLVTGATAAAQSITAAGKLTLAGIPAAGGGTGVGASLALGGASVDLGGKLSLPSGNLTATATGTGGLAITGVVDVSGASRNFYEVPRYAPGGAVTLVATQGAVTMADGAVVDVSGAAPLAGDTSRAGAGRASAAGTVAISAPLGAIGLAGKIRGAGDRVGNGGNISLDAAAFGAGDFTAFAKAFTAGGFDASVALRARSGDLLLDGRLAAHTIAVAADAGSITVAGTLDASGSTGGNVNLAAGGAVTVAAGATIDASANAYDSAGQGGSVRIEAGAPRYDASGNAITPAASAAVDLRGRVALGVGAPSMAFAAGAQLTFANGVTGGNTVTFSAAGSYRQPDGKLVPVPAGQAVTLPAGVTVTLAQAGTVLVGGTGIGGSVGVTLADGSRYSLRPAAGTAEFDAAQVADVALGRRGGTLYLRAPLLDGAGNPLAAGAAIDAGVDVAVRPIAGSITGASDVVVEGYRAFVPVAGVIDTVESSVVASGTAFAAQAGTLLAPGPVRTRLLSAQPGLARQLRVIPGAEIVNPAAVTGTTLTLTAGTTNSTILLQSGASFTVAGLTNAATRLVSASGSGRILTLDGKTIPFATTSTNLSLPAGARVVMDSAGVATVGVTSTSAGNGTLVLENGATLGSQAGGTFTTGTGTTLTLRTASTNAANQSTVTVPAGTPVVALNGGRLRFSAAGSYRAMDGTVTSFAAAATPTLPAGAVITLNSAGSIGYFSGTAAPTLALTAGSYGFTRTIEMIPAAGDLRLQTAWNLAPARYAGEPGALALRAAGNLLFNGALSDGFASAAYDAALLPAGSRSSSFRLTAGADLLAADARVVRPASSLAAGSGSIVIGQTTGANVSGDGALTKDAVAGRYQVVRTGTGDIVASAARDVVLLNQFASLYTAGTATTDPTLGQRFDTPVLDQKQYDGGQPLGAPQQEESYPAQFSRAGGNVSVTAGGDIARRARDGVGRYIDDSEQQLPNNWLYRRGLTDPATGKFFQGAVDPETGRLVASATGEVKSTAWWVDFSNYFEGIGALGGGNVTLLAGRDVLNVDALAPTNARLPGRDALGQVIGPGAELVELGGGDVTVRAGRDINGGAYYVERGTGVLAAGRAVTTNATRRLNSASQNAPEAWLPTTLFLGKGRFDVFAGGDVRLGPVGNLFLLPAGISGTVTNKAYFATYDPADQVDVASLTGSVRLSRNAPDDLLYLWLSSVQLYNSGITTSSSASFSRPWLRLAENSVQGFRTVTGISPASLRATAYAGDIFVTGDLTLAPSSTGTLELMAQGAIKGLNPISRQKTYGYGTMRLLDTAVSTLPGPASPLASIDWSVADVSQVGQSIFSGVDRLVREGQDTGNDSLPTRLSRHAAGPLHAGDASPVRLYTATGDISGVELMAGKSGRVVAGRDVTDIALMLQNNSATDASLVAAGRDIVAFAPNSELRQLAAKSGYARGNERIAGKSGLIEIGGPGTLEVLAGRNLDLGVDPANVAAGIVSVGSSRNPRLPFGSADIVAAAGFGRVYGSDAAAQLQAPGVLSSGLGLARFIGEFLQPGTPRGERYLPVLGAAIGMARTASTQEISAVLLDGGLTEAKALALVDTFLSVLRTSGRDFNNPESPLAATYRDGLAAIAALFPGSPLPTDSDIAAGVTQARSPGPAVGSVLMPTREIKTFEGGDITVLAPSGGVTVGRATDPQKADQGILTERGGGISVYAADNVEVGTSRIFTLRGGPERIWSTWGNIAAGSGSKTVFAAPPTRVVIDAQSGDVQTDLAGLATGAGIGVLATRAGVAPDDVDLIAPVGTVDAGDAGIRSTGNLNISARVVLNAGNIQVGGVSTGTPPPPAAPNLPAMAAATSVSAADASAASEIATRSAAAAPRVELPSLITVEVMSYGGADEEQDDGRKPGGNDQVEAKEESHAG